jgi:hypothetical protein
MKQTVCWKHSSMTEEIKQLFGLFKHVKFRRVSGDLLQVTKWVINAQCFFIFQISLRALSFICYRISASIFLRTVSISSLKQTKRVPYIFAHFRILISNYQTFSFWWLYNHFRSIFVTRNNKQYFFEERKSLQTF